MAGTINLLKAAAAEPAAKSVVLTSSSVAALVPEPNKVIKVDESESFSVNFVHTYWYVR